MDWKKINEDKKAGNKAALAQDYANLKRDKEAYNQVDSRAHQDEQIMKKDDANFDKIDQNRNKDFKDVRKNFKDVRTDRKSKK